MTPRINSFIRHVVGIISGVLLAAGIDIDTTALAALVSDNGALTTAITAGVLNYLWSYREKRTDDQLN